WRLISRYSYSFLEKKPLEQFFGWEYDACCWRLRVVGRRYVSRRTGESDSSIAVQLELKGFSQRVPSPEELLDRGILGYRGTGASSDDQSEELEGCFSTDSRLCRGLVRRRVHDRGRRGNARARRH